MTDAKIVYVLSVLNDLYPGEWDYTVEPTHRVIVTFHRKSDVGRLNWANLSLVDNHISGRSCLYCLNPAGWSVQHEWEQHNGWSGWHQCDFCDDNAVRIKIKSIVGIEQCKCGGSRNAP